MIATTPVRYLASIRALQIRILFLAGFLISLSAVTASAGDVMIDFNSLGSYLGKNTFNYQGFQWVNFASGPGYYGNPGRDVYTGNTYHDSYTIRWLGSNNYFLKSMQICWFLPNTSQPVAVFTGYRDGAQVYTKSVALSGYRSFKTLSFNWLVDTIVITGNRGNNSGDMNGVAIDIDNFSYRDLSDNKAPVISQGDSTTVDMSEDGSPTLFSLTLNAADPEGDAINWSLASPAAHGAAEVNGSGANISVKYTPNANYNGDDSFQVRADDGFEAWDTITVQVNIAAEQDAPDAVDDQISIPANASATIPVLDNDSDIDGDTLTIQTFTQGVYGRVSIDGTNLIYTANPFHRGADEFTYTIQDGNEGVDTATVFVDVTAPVFNIMASLPKTGIVENYGREVNNGVLLALEDINNQGAMHLDLQIEDNESSLTNEEDSFNAATGNQEILAVVGGVISAHALEMGKIASNMELPLFSPTATSQILNSSQYNQYVIKISPLDNYQIEAVLSQLESLNIQKIVLLNEDSPYGEGFYDGLSAAEETIQVLEHYAFPYGELDLETAIPIIRDASVAGAQIGVIAAYDQDANRLLKRLSEIPELMNFGWIMTDGAAIEATLEELPFDNELYVPRLYGLTPSIADNLDKSQDFKSKFVAQFSEKPEWLSYYGYDSLMACAAALNRATEQTRAGIWDAISNLQYDGATGQKWFDEKGLLQSAVYDVKKVINGEFVILSELRVKQPGVQNSSAGKVQTRSMEPLNGESDLLFEGFRYTLPGADQHIGHIAGGAGPDGSWIAQSRDYNEGQVLMAFYEDAVRGLTDNGEPFGFQDGITYNLAFDMNRTTVVRQVPSGDSILEVKVTLVCRYRDGNGVQRFANKDLVEKAVTFAEWPQEGPFLLDIPVPYSSVAPVGADYAAEDQLLNWEISLLNAAHQAITLKSVSIIQGDTTDIKNYMLY